MSSSSVEPPSVPPGEPLRVLITGAAGQVGRELRRAHWSEIMSEGGEIHDVELIAHDADGLDITDRHGVLAAVDRAQPDVIVNAAAYTAVDRAEDEPDRAAAVNATAVAHLAEAADRAGAMLVQISTDYVFDGTKDGWYVESDAVNPLGVYGRTKLAGEERALAADRSVVLRTAWVYGALGSNFVTAMLRLARERDEIGVVADQVGCPTAAADIAAAIVELVKATHGGRSMPPHRLYHLASPTAVSWFDLANAVFAASGHGYGGICRPLRTDQYPTRARRPANSRLDSSLLARELGIGLPSFEQSLKSVVAELEADLPQTRSTR